MKLYRGICLLEKEDTESAIQDFVAVAESNSIFKDQAMWYLALSLIKTDKKEEAKTWLSNLRDRGEFKVKEAKEMLELLIK